jgi:hypothetical protein
MGTLQTITPSHFRLTFDEVAQTVLNDFKADGRRLIEVVERRITKHLEPFFGVRSRWELSQRRASCRRALR